MPGDSENSVPQNPKSDMFRMSTRDCIVDCACGVASCPIFAKHDDSSSSSAQSRAQYEETNFAWRFYANYHTHLTHKMDCQDLTRDRLINATNNQGDEAYRDFLRMPPPRALVIHLETNQLFHPEQRAKVVRCFSYTALAFLKSIDGRGNSYSSSRR